MEGGISADNVGKGHCDYDLVSETLRRLVLQ